MKPVPVRNDLRCETCPVCESPRIAPTGRLDYAGIARFSSCEVHLSETPELWTCLGCGSGFVQNVIDEPTARDLYTAGEAGGRWSTPRFEQCKTTPVVRALRALLLPGTRVLDIGANTGELLDFAAAAGCETTGVEFSQSSRSALRTKGHRACATLAEAEDGYQIVTAFDLVEHLHDVSTFFKACHERLAVGGCLVVLTGDIQSPSARAAREHWWYAQYPEHIVFPSRARFSALPGFRMRALYRTYASVGYHQSGLLGWAQRLRRRVQGRAYNGLPSLGPDHLLVVLERVSGPAQ
jgi:SAM-dependent methyltransferase